MQAPAGEAGGLWLALTALGEFWERSLDKKNTVWTFLTEEYLI